uniref:hypothetical protein n=1 Tax=Streptococcus sobrinus TaxID=1310 RepID=UPI0003694D00
DVERAINTPIKERKNTNIKNVYITDEEYEIAKENGINANALVKRVRDLGMDKQEAITKPLREMKYKKWRKVAIQNGINIQTFYTRINKYNWTPKKAATTPIMVQKKIS